MANRPPYKPDTRVSVIARYDGKCARCGEALRDDTQLHHDYEGHNWARVRDVTDSDEMQVLLTDEQRKDAHKEIYNDENHMQPMHPECHKDADFWQQNALRLSDIDNAKVK